MTQSEFMNENISQLQSHFAKNCYIMLFSDSYIEKVPIIHSERDTFLYFCYSLISITI